MLQDVEPLKNVRPQLARPASGGVEGAFQLMKGKPFLVETKFDGEPLMTPAHKEDPSLHFGNPEGHLGAGERIQVHRKGSQMAFYSRRALEHGTQSSYNILIPVFEKQMKPGDFILDGELIVWNKSK